MLRASARPASLAAAGALGVLCGAQFSCADATARADAASAPTGEPLVAQGPENKWIPNITTKHWHFYRGKMHPNAAKTLKLFQCADTPIANEIANYLGVEVNKMQGASLLRGCIGVIWD